MRRFKYVFILAMVGLAVGIAIKLKVGSLGRTSAVESISRLLPQGVNLALEGIHVTKSDGQRTVWTLDGKQAEYSPDQQQVTLRQVIITFFGKEEEGGTITLVADRGQYDTSAKDFSVEGNVVVTFEGGYVLRTDSLQYTDAGRVITTQDPVELTGPRTTVTGNGLEHYIQDRRVKVLRNVHTVVRSAPAKATSGATGDALPG